MADYPQPDIGDRVTYFDGDGEPHQALVLDDVSDAEYITVVYGADGDLGEVYNHTSEDQSSVYPHAELGEQFTSTTDCFKPGWQ